jgi:hypothetical protein
MKTKKPQGQIAVWMDVDQLEASIDAIEFALVDGSEWVTLPSEGGSGSVVKNRGALGALRQLRLALQAMVPFVLVLLMGCGPRVLDIPDTREVQSELACAKLKGRFMGFGTVTTSDKAKCGAEVGDVAPMGIDFANSGDFVSWVNAGEFGLTCTTTYSGCSVVVRCTNGIPANQVDLVYTLTITEPPLTQNGPPSVAGTYELIGAGAYCPLYRADLVLTK